MRFSSHCMEKNTPAGSKSKSQAAHVPSTLQVVTTTFRGCSSCR